MQKKITYGGLGCALCVLLLLGASYLPTLKAALLFLASVMPYVVFRVTDVKIAFAMYGATSILAFLTCQSGSPAIVASFIICFGNYPIFMAIVDRFGFWIRNIAKFALYTIYFFGIYIIFTRVLLLPVPYSPYLFFGVGAIVFYIYDCLIVQTGDYLMQRMKL